MDSDNVIRPGDIAEIIHTDEKPPQVGVTYFANNDTNKATPDLEMKLVIPETEYKGKDNYYSDGAFIDLLYIRLPEALKAAREHLSSIDVSQLTPAEQSSYQDLINLTSGEHTDLGSINFDAVHNLLMKVAIDLKEKGDPQDRALIRALLSAYPRLPNMDNFSDSRKTYADLVHEAMKSKYDAKDSAAYKDITYERRIGMHEQTHLADHQAHAGRLVSVDRRYEFALRRHADNPSAIATMRQIRTIIGDVLEARAYIAEISGRMIRDSHQTDEGYYHPGMCMKLLLALQKTLVLSNERFTDMFVRNDAEIIPGIDVIHEEHVGGALLLAFIDKDSKEKIIQDLSYERVLVDEEPDVNEPHRVAIIKTFQDLIRNPQLSQSRLEESWDVLGGLLDSLVTRLDDELNVLEPESASDHHEDSPIPETTT